MTSNRSENLDKLLLIFVHGFGGSDTSFKDFPNRLRTILTNTVRADVDAVVYPSYKTAGDLRVAVENFSSWLCNEVSKLQEENKRIGNEGKIMIVLLGHSMGGFVSAETILRFYNNTNNCNEQLLGAQIIGMLAYDTPFYSINQNFVADRAWSSVDQINREVGRYWNTGSAAAGVTAATMGTRAITAGNNTKSSGGGNKWGLWAGVVGAAALGAAAYMAREKITTTITDAYDQLTFISHLTDKNGCDQRIRQLLRVPHIFFKCFYVQLNEPGSDHRPKTFINLPPDDLSYLFVPVLSSSDNEVSAHTSMFNPKKTDHYYELGADSIALINEMVVRFQRRNSGRPPVSYPYYPPVSTSDIPSKRTSESSIPPKSQPTAYPYYPPPTSSTTKPTSTPATSSTDTDPNSMASNDDAYKYPPPPP